MNDQLTQRLVRRFPVLYQDYHSPMSQTCMCWGFDHADATRVLRVPGFVNRKYARDGRFIVQARQESARIYSLREFTVNDDSPDSARFAGDSSRSPRSVSRGHRSQSEADWAYAKRALSRGDAPEEVMRRIADYRAHDKHDPEYYARRTVLKAQAEMQKTGTGPDELRTDEARVDSKGL